MDALSLIKREVTVDEYHRIREAWKTHSIAEDRRDVKTILSTLTDDCVYEAVGTSRTWEGLEGARSFYRELLTAFPDLRFELQNIVIGPQGVFEEAVVYGTFVEPFLDVEPTGKELTFTAMIYFPWDPVQKKFKGERVYAPWNELGLIAPPQATEPPAE